MKPTKKLPDPPNRNVVSDNRDKSTDITCPCGYRDNADHFDCLGAELDGGVFCPKCGLEFANGERLLFPEIPA